MNNNQFEKFERKIFKLDDLIDYQEDAIVSRTLIDKETGTLTVFAFDKGQSLSEHTAPHDAMIVGLDGKGKVFIDEDEFILNKGESILMQANIPHSVKAIDRFKMFLIMIR